MKWKTLNFVLLYLFCFVTLFINSAYADNEWETIFKNLSIDDEITPGSKQTASLYGATVVFTITDVDNSGDDFRGVDTINLEVTGYGVDLIFPGGTKDELVEWSENNMDDLFKAIFGNAPDTTVSGMTDSQSITQQLFSSVYATPEPKGTKFHSISNKDIVLKGQYDFLEIEEYDAKGISGIIAYEHRLKNFKGHSIGISVPYRQLSLDDNIDSKYNFISFLPFYKHQWYPTRALVEWVVHGTVGATYLESALFPDGGGFLEYGGGTGVKYAYAVNERVSVNTGLALLILKKNIPSDLVPDDIAFIAEALSNLPTEIDLTPSVGVYAVVIPDKLFLRGDLFRTHQLQDDVVSGLENQTVIIGGLTYMFPKGSRVSFGYKRSFEMEDIKDQSFLLDFKIEW